MKEGKWRGGIGIGDEGRGEEKSGDREDRKDFR